MTDPEIFKSEALQNPGIVVVSAIIPSTHAIGYVLKDGDLPYLIHERGLYEQTFSRIGNDVIGRALSIDHAQWFLPNWMVGFAKPIDHRAVTLGRGAVWCGTETSPAIANYAKGAFRWWKRND